MPRISSQLVGNRGAEIAGLAPQSRARSIAASSFIVTTVSVQGIRTQVEECLDALETANLAVKNTCTRMVSSRTITEDDLDSDLRVPLIDQFMRTYQEEAEEFRVAADEVAHELARTLRLIA